MRHPREKAFSRSVPRYHGDRRVRRLNRARQCCAIAFARLTGRGRSRDLTAGLNADPAKLHHAGFASSVRVSTPTHANEQRRRRPRGT